MKKVGGLGDEFATMSPQPNKAVTSKGKSLGKHSLFVDKITL
jgi:hypothetical protein